MRRFIALFLMVLGGVAGADELPQDLRRAQVVILGEVHDNAAIHLRQAELLAALNPKAVVFEMLTEAQAASARVELRKDAKALEAALNWSNTGWPDFALYFPVFEAAGEAAFFGAAVPRKEARAAMKAGVAASFGPQAEEFGLTAALPEVEQSAREHEQHLAHCEAMPPEMLPIMVSLQRLRDATLARAVVEALEETGGPVAVITGNGHARRDWGVPAYLARVSPGVTVFSLGLLEEGGEAGDKFDGFERFPQAEREDPCKAFQKS